MRMANSKFLMGVLACGLSVSVLAVDRNSLNSTIQINYGTVKKIEHVKIDSGVGKGAVAGGLIGAGTSGKHDRAKHAAEGAAAVAILTAIAEGKRKAYSYEVSLTSGSTIKLVTENGGIDEGDCVSIEQGQTANIRRVSPVFCEAPNHEVLNHPYVQAKSYEEAAECHTAKEMAMHAKTEQEVDIAIKKVQIFCDN